MELVRLAGSIAQRNAALICLLIGLVASLPYTKDLLAAAGIILGALFFGLSVQSILDRISLHRNDRRCETNK